MKKLKDALMILCLQPHQEWSRICLIPVLEQLDEDRKGSMRIDTMSKSSCSRSEAILLRDKIKAKKVKRLAEEITQDLPKTCGNRLAFNYATLIHCTQLVREFI